MRGSKTNSMPKHAKEMVMGKISVYSATAHTKLYAQPPVFDEPILKLTYKWITGDTEASIHKYSYYFLYG